MHYRGGRRGEAAHLWLEFGVGFDASHEVGLGRAELLHQHLEGSNKLEAHRSEACSHINVVRHARGGEGRAERRGGEGRTGREGDRRREGVRGGRESGT